MPIIFVYQKPQIIALAIHSFNDKNKNRSKLWIHSSSDFEIGAAFEELNFSWSEPGA
jgi:hypothetical protein